MADFFCAKYGLFVFNFFIAVSTFTYIVIVDEFFDDFTS